MAKTSVNVVRRRPKRSSALTAKLMTGIDFAPPDVIAAISSKPSKLEPLLAGYVRSVVESRAAGRAVSFRVEVDPTGDATVTPVEAASTPADADLAAALDEARNRGRASAARILAGGDMLNADQFAEFLGTSRMTVNTKRQQRQLLGLEGAKRGFRFPVWQVGEDGKPFAALPRLFERLGGGPWSVYRFLVQPHPELDGMTGREAFRRGKTDEALAVAESIADSAFA